MRYFCSRFGVSVDTSFVESATLGTGTNPSTVKNSTPLIKVVERGDELMARLLVGELGADPNHVIMVSCICCPWLKLVIIPGRAARVNGLARFLSFG